MESDDKQGSPILEKKGKYRISEHSLSETVHICITVSLVDYSKHIARYFSWM